METELREYKRMFLEQKRHSADLAAQQETRQEALEREVAALKCMLGKMTRMWFENRGGQCDFPFNSNAVSLLVMGNQPP